MSDLTLKFESSVLDSPDIATFIQYVEDIAIDFAPGSEEDEKKLFELMMSNRYNVSVELNKTIECSYAVYMQKIERQGSTAYGVSLVVGNDIFWDSTIKEMMNGGDPGDADGIGFNVTITPKFATNRVSYSCNIRPVTSEAVAISLEYTNVILTKTPYKKAEPKIQAYPSIERSLDKIVDKMEGNMVTSGEQTKVYTAGPEVDSGAILIDYHEGDFPAGLNGSIEFVINDDVLYSGNAVTMETTDPDTGNSVIVITSPDFDGQDMSSADFIIVEQTADGQAISAFSPISESFMQKVMEYLNDEDSRLTAPITVTAKFAKTVPAYEVFKEAVPSVEHSLYKIADLLEIGDKEEESPEGTVYDDTNVNRYTIKCDSNNITIYDNLGDETITETTPQVSPSDFIKIVKSNPFCVNRLTASLSIVETDVTPDLYVLSAFVDSGNRLYLSFNPSNSLSETRGSIYYEFLFTGGVVIDFERGACNFNGIHMIVSRREGGALSFIGGNNILRR